MSRPYTFRDCLAWLWTIIRIVHGIRAGRR